MKNVYCANRLVTSIIVLLLCISCNYEKSDEAIGIENIKNWPSPKISKNYRLPIYKITAQFDKILDTIIFCENKCPFYRPVRNGFLFSSSLFQEEGGACPDIIVISSLNLFTYDYSKAIGIFTYKGYCFVCDSSAILKTLEPSPLFFEINNSFFMRADKKAGPDDTFSTWLYCLTSENEIVFSGHNVCKSN